MRKFHIAYRTSVMWTPCAIPGLYIEVLLLFPKDKDGDDCHVISVLTRNLILEEVCELHFFLAMISFVLVKCPTALCWVKVSKPGNASLWKQRISLCTSQPSPTYGEASCAWRNFFFFLWFFEFLYTV